jgi:hypothetical protein
MVTSAMVLTPQMELPCSAAVDQANVDAVAKLRARKTARVETAHDLLAEPVIKLGQCVLYGLAVHQVVGPGGR